VLSQRYGAINLHPSLIRAPPLPAGEGRGEGSHKRALDESIHSLGNGCSFPLPYRIVPNKRRAQSQPEDSRDSRPDLSGNPPIRTILLAKNRLPILKKSSNSSLSTLGTPAAMAVVGASSAYLNNNDNKDYPVDSSATLTAGNTAPKTTSPRIQSSFSGSVGNLVEGYSGYLCVAFSLYFAKAFSPYRPTAQRRGHLRRGLPRGRASRSLN